MSNVLVKLTAAKSGFPCPVKSPTANEIGEGIPVIGDPLAFEKFTPAVGVETGKKTTLERPPPGAGFTMEIEAVVAVAIFADGTNAVSCREFTNVVANALLLKFTVAPCTKPVPLTASVNAGPPGAAAVGTNAWFRNGTGLPGALFEVIEMLRKPCSAIAPTASTSCTSKYQVPPPVGVPLMVPEAIFRPKGSPPPAMAQVKGCVPPVSLTVWL